MATFDTSIATTILEQIGGNRFRVMTGAKAFRANRFGLEIVLPSNFASEGINLINIVLAPSDTYAVVFSRKRGARVTPLHSFTDIYAEDLKSLISKTTGLALSL